MEKNSYGLIQSQRTALHRFCETEEGVSPSPLSDQAIYCIMSLVYAKYRQIDRQIDIQRDIQVHFFIHSDCRHQDVNFRVCAFHHHRKGFILHIQRTQGFLRILYHHIYPLLHTKLSSLQAKNFSFHFPKLSDKDIFHKKITMYVVADRQDFSHLLKHRHVYFFVPHAYFPPY